MYIHSNISIALKLFVFKHLTLSSSLVLDVFLVLVTSLWD